MFLSILWHLHQPMYRNPETNEFILPWVNFHLTKNYYQMACLAEELDYPCTFNLVPCLVEQIEQYSRGQATDVVQKAVEADPETLTPSQVKWLSRFLPPGTQARDRRSLQLEALLSFFSPLLKTKQEKDFLLDLQKKTYRQVIPYYRKLWKKGTVELTTSAYYHPLLPLLFDLGVGGEEHMPSLPFRYPEDGEAQIEKGREYFKQVFGDYPSGFWPSEGGISQDVARAVSGKGFAFAVTDENVLWKSLKTAPHPKLLHKPYLCQDLTLFFRDRELSDLLSFEYHSWKEKEAAAHFLAKVEERKKASPPEAICVIALDGENPWAGYRENGVPFLREFYSQIKQKKGLTPVLFKDYLNICRPDEKISIAPGTWLGNFSKWVGSPVKNAAWESLSKAREFCGPREEIFVAEGSDWFWWFGEDHVAEFEALFESYLRRACKNAGPRSRP